MSVVTEQMISQGELWVVVFVHDDKSQGNTTGRLPFECGPEQMSSLMDLWIVVFIHGGSGQGDTTGRELDDRVVVRGHDDSGQNAWKIRDLITLGSSAVAELATEVFSCAYEACSAWNVSVPSHENGTLTTGQKYVGEYDVANDLSDLGPMLSRQTHYTLTKFSVQRKVAEVNYLSFGTFSSELSKGATTTMSLVSDIAFVIVSLTECPDSDLESYLKKPIRMRSNTTNARVLTKSVFLDVILPGACPACPRILTTSPNKRQIRSVQQSHGKFVGIECNTEENDDMHEENYMSVYVKMINGKTISLKYHRSMTAAVISDEVERRSLIPRDMTRLVHKGKMLSEKKTMKENNIEAEATIEMSLRLLGGMEVNEQMDTHETEEDREKKRKLEEGKEGKATKPTDDMVYLKRDIMEALKDRMKKWIVTQERPMKKWRTSQEKLMKK